MIGILIRVKMYLKSLSVVCTGEELVVPYNQFSKNLVGGLVGCYSYNLCHMGSQGIFFFPRVCIEQSMYIMDLKVSEQPD